MLREDGENRKLRERCEELEEEARQLREELAPQPLSWRFLGLSPQEALLLAALHKTAPGWSARERLVSLLERHGAAMNTQSALSTRIHYLIRRLQRWGVDIAMHWGVGYSLTAAAKARLDALRAEFAADPALPKFALGRCSRPRGRPRP